MTIGRARKSPAAQQKGDMPVNWMMVATIAALGAALAACSPSPQQFQPADPLAGAGGVQIHLGGCSAATSTNGAGCQP